MEPSGVKHARRSVDLTGRSSPLSISRRFARPLLRRILPGTAISPLSISVHISQGCPQRSFGGWRMLRRHLRLQMVCYYCLVVLEYLIIHISVIMDELPLPAAHAPSPSAHAPSPPPATPIPASQTATQTRASKGKAHEDPRVVSDQPRASQPDHPYSLRGTKRSAPAEPSATPAGPSQAGAEGEITPRRSTAQPTSGIPRVEVENPSPPHPSRRARTDGGSVATGKVSV